MNRFLNKYALSCALITLLASCQSAPRVIADLEGNYPSRKSDSVKIYEVGKPVPAEARAIGKVSVLVWQHAGFGRKENGRKWR